MGVEVVCEPGVSAFVEAIYSSPVTAADTGDHLRIARAAFAAGTPNSLIVFTDDDAPREWFTLFLSSLARSASLPSARRAIVDPSGTFSTVVSAVVMKAADKPFTVFATREAAVAWLLAGEQEGE